MTTHTVARSRGRASRTRDEGQAIIEFAVIFPIIVFFIFAILEIGLGLNRQATLQHAAREGARFAAVADNSDNGAAAKTRTIEQSNNLVDASDVIICYDDIDGSGSQNAGDAVDVKILYNYNPPFLSNFIPLGTFNMDVTGSARLERSLTSPGAVCTS